MAKLYRHETFVDVVGNVTKVIRMDEEYIHSNDSAEIGDLVLCTKIAPYLAVGKFYYVEDIEEGDIPKIRRFGSDSELYAVPKGYYAVFRKTDNERS
ncbi:hypothetical protein P8825_14185 [Shouchella clausii]|uniref:hypothetical protein n=1 Tax=Shouchella clausii TaxID=79880 RepID=UPI002DBC34EE|nr:hypothetical protein [Shouchella clausii]MEB5480712.1 hypothetical protein [Shouchella clausii]